MLSSFSSHLLAVMAAGAACLLYLVRRRRNRSHMKLPPGTVVVISGASRGLGRATALHLAQIGIKVFAGVRRKQDGEALRSEAQEAGYSGDIIPLQMDVTSSSSVNDAARVARETSGVTCVHSVICCAGVGLLGPLELTDIERFRAVMDVQAWGTARLLQAFGPLLRRSSGSKPRLVLCSSPVERMAMPLMGANVLSRHATAGIAKLVEIETSGWEEPLRCVTVWPLGVTSGQSEEQLPQLDALARQVSVAQPDSPEAAYAQVVHGMHRMIMTMGYDNDAAKKGKRTKRLILPADVAGTMADAALMRSPPRLMVAGRGGPIPFISSLPVGLQIFGMRKRLGVS